MELCKKYKLERQEKWHEPSPEDPVKNEVKLLRDVNIHCDNVIKARRYDIVVVNKGERKCIIVEIAVPDDSKASGKGNKVEKIPRFEQEIRRIWNMRSIIIVAVIVGALGSKN